MKAMTFKAHTNVNTNQAKGTARSGLQMLTAIMTALMLVLVTTVAEARGGRGGSMGSRGSRTWQSAPATPTAPGSVLPMQRSTTPSQPQRPATQQPGPTTQTAQPQGGGFFSRGGFMPGLMGGLIGAGLFGMLFGHGFMGGLGSMAGLLGFLLQIGLIILIVRFALSYFRRRQEGPAYAGAAPAMTRDAVNNGTGYPGTSYGSGYGSGMGAAGTAARPERRDQIGISQADFDTFENSLRAIQTAYGQRDMATLQRLLTPEMLSYFRQELSDDMGRGVTNRVSDVKLLQGDLAESWREDGMDFATVAMRYQLVDVTVENATGRVVEGDPNRPVEVTEIWTFLRPQGGSWLLSAIQQTS